MISSSFVAEADVGFGGKNKTVLNSPYPVAKYCYHCKRVISTRIRYYPTLKTRIIAAALSPCFLCWVPFFCHWKSEIDHHCAFCDSYLGTFDPDYEKKENEAYARLRETETRKHPLKKYREVGRRCGEFTETIAGREDLVTVYNDVLQ